MRPSGSPAHAGMVRPKRQIFVDSFIFEVPKPEGKPKKSTAPRRKTAARPKPTNRKKTKPKAAPKPRAPKPRAQPTPAEVEARKETRREYDRRRSQTPERKELKRRNMQQRRERARLLGTCVECEAPSIPDETRCQTCTLRHREYQRQSKLRAAQKGRRNPARAGSSDDNSGSGP